MQNNHLEYKDELPYRYSVWLTHIREKDHECHRNSNFTLNLNYAADESKKATEVAIKERLICLNTLMKLETDNDMNYFMINIFDVSSHDEERVPFTIENEKDVAEYLFGKLLNEQENRKYEYITICELFMILAEFFQDNDLIFEIGKRCIGNFQNKYFILMFQIALERSPRKEYYDILNLLPNEYYISSLNCLLCSFEPPNKEQIIYRLLQINKPAFTSLERLKLTKDEIIKFNIFEYIVNALNNNDIKIIRAALHYITINKDIIVFDNSIYQYCYDIFLSCSYSDKCIFIKFFDDCFLLVPESVKKYWIDNNLIEIVVDFIQNSNLEITFRVLCIIYSYLYCFPYKIEEHNINDIYEILMNCPISEGNIVIKRKQLLNKIKEIADLD